MKRTDYILTIAAGFLKTPEAKEAELINYFEQRFELKKPQKPGFVSLAGEIAGTRLSFTDWVKALKKEEVKDVSFNWMATDGRLPAHIAAAFAGTQELMMQVVTANSKKDYFLASFRSPQYEIKTEQLVALIDQQRNSEGLWDRTWELLDKSNSLNNRSAIDRKQIKEYLFTEEGEGELAFMLGQVIEEIQIECEIAGEEFNIKGFESLFYKSDFSFGGSDKEYVYLYTEQEVGVKELSTLTDAQSFEKEIWPLLIKKLEEYNYSNLPVFKAEEWKSKLQDLNTEQLQEVANLVCRCICELCEDKGLKPVVPDSVKAFYGPDELENKRAQARSKVSNKQWYLESIKQPWELYSFVEFAGGETEPVNFAKTEREFVVALKEIAAFAEEIQSPFKQAFTLGDYLLTESKPDGIFDEQHLERLAGDLKTRGFSERAVDNFRNSFYYSADLLMLDWPEEKIYGFLAHDLADVFGGMGSWNDQYMESEEQQQTFDRLSAALFQSMKTYFGSLVSG